jgi:hypothetical protein
MKGRIPALLLAAAIYAVVGLTFGALANSASNQSRIAWRWAAWLVSILTFAAHIGYEAYVRRSLRRTAAATVALAAALGAFALAAAANVHRLTSRPGTADSHAVALGLSLVLWPAIVFVPAFVVAFISTTLLLRVAPARSG